MSLLPNLWLNLNNILDTYFIGMQIEQWMFISVLSCSLVKGKVTPPLRHTALGIHGR